MVWLVSLSGFKSFQQMVVKLNPKEVVNVSVV